MAAAAPHRNAIRAIRQREWQPRHYAGAVFVAHSYAVSAAAAPIRHSCQADTPDSQVGVPAGIFVPNIAEDLVRIDIHLRERDFARELVPRFGERAKTGGK